MCRDTALPNQTTCKILGCNKPIFVDQFGNARPFCSKTCANRHNSNLFFSSPPPYSRSSPQQTRTSNGLCKTQGCNKPVYVELSGRAHEYCSRTCARKFLLQQEFGVLPSQLQQHQQQYQQVPSLYVQQPSQQQQLPFLPPGYQYVIAPILSIPAPTGQIPSTGQFVGDAALGAQLSAGLHARAASTNSHNNNLAEIGGNNRSFTFSPNTAENDDGKRPIHYNASSSGPLRDSRDGSSSSRKESMSTDHSPRVQVFRPSRVATDDFVLIDENM
ncbi:7796_t:CDS:2 [Ambispora leptoticha]|uniref:7796_t:CDS:1 n=1 Tax=Ambispora leptoticha TaxID=144679 RepID=A0A9N8WFQ8_9GLOM|nr:7796_t:CDS:2 [Ambispora leptoticha]